MGLSKDWEMTRRARVMYYAQTPFQHRISLTIVDTPGFGDNIDNERW